MMRIPYQHITIQSSLRKERLVKALKNNVSSDRTKFYWGRRFKNKFRGNVSSRSFNLVPVVPYWNISPVRLKGSIENSSKGSVMKIKASATFFKTLLFMCSLLTAGLLYQYFYVEKESMYLWGILIVWASGYTFTAVPFYIELRKSLGRLRMIAQSG